MHRIKEFSKTSLLGGLAVILPVAIVGYIFQWMFNWITDLIQPLSNLVVEKWGLPEIFADIVVIGIILGGCFFVGAIVRTRVGRFIHENLENRILRIAPGYTTIKEIVVQFFGKERTPFSAVALVQVFENRTLMTGFITDTHEDSYTIFVPTGPNPTSGNIFHLKKEYVHPVNVPVEKGMRSIISCGAGSSELLASLATTGGNQQKRMETTP